MTGWSVDRVRVVIGFRFLGRFLAVTFYDHQHQGIPSVIPSEGIAQQTRILPRIDVPLQRLSARAQRNATRLGTERKSVVSGAFSSSMRDNRPRN